MTTLLLILLTICSFLFYGVVGPDKSWVLAPVFVLAYVAIAVALIKRSVQLSAACRKPDFQSQSSLRAVGSYEQEAAVRLPSSVFWLLFLIWGIALIPTAIMPFDAKVRMLFFGAVIGSYLVWGQELTAFKDNRVVLGWLIFVVMLAALYGLVAHIKSPDSILWSERYTDHYDGRLASTYICPNHFAHLMQMLLPFCIALLFIPQAGIYLKILAGYSFLTFMPPLFLTESRAGWLGSIAAVGITVCLMALRRSKKLFAALVILVPLCSLLLLFGAWKYSETFQRRMTPVVQFIEAQSNGGIGSDSPDFRPLTWLDTLDMIGAAPVSGYGPGSYRYAYPEFRNRFKGNQIVTGHPHNEYLELTAEFGWVGFGLFALAWIYGAVWVLVKSLRSKETRHAFLGFALLGTVAGTMVHSFFDFEMHIFPNAMVFALLAALAVGPLCASRRGKLKTEPTARREDRGRKTEGGGQPPSHEAPAYQGRAEGKRDEALGVRRRARGTDSRVSDEKLGTKDSGQGTEKEQQSTSNLSTIIRAAFSWLLTISFLAATVFCVQTMTSSVFRDLGDRTVEVQPVSLDDVAQAEVWYHRAVKLDRSNWRAYQGMGKLKHDERRHCLERVEKVRLAEEERSWYEQALLHNAKDPESLIGLGRCLLFLSRVKDGERRIEDGVQRTEDGGLGTEDGGLGTGGKLRTEDGGLGTEYGGRKTEDGGQTLSPSTQHQIPNLETRGLDFLREACRYRKFNDHYWWMLGVELRKSGDYVEALSVFQQMETVKRTPSSRKNIQWLEKQLEEDGDQKTASGPEGPTPRREDGRERTEVRGPSAKDQLNQLDAENETESDSLENLFQLMDP